MKQEIKERIELINKGIVPAGYKKTSVGICPVEWIETILGKICEINPKTERLKSTFQYIDLESIVNGKVVAIKMINKQNAPSRAQRVLSKNDIIYQLVRPYQKNNFLLKNINENQGYVKTMWCGSSECEEKIHELTGAKSRCIPFNQEHISDTCVCCGKPASKMVVWGRQY